MSSKILVLVVALAVAPAASAAVLRVPADHATIQGAIAAAATGDTVVVAPGTYLENLDFLGKAISVQSEAGPEVTIVDARRLGAAVRFQTGEGPGSVLTGFTLRNGFTDEEGGCVVIASASPTVTGNHVIACESTTGGGGIGVSFSSASVRGNVVVGNHTRYLGGGGIAVTGAGSAEIVGNLVADNACDTDGGGIVLWAAGTPLVSGNVIRDNVTSAAGGGMAMYNWADADVVQNAIFGNSARTGGGVAAFVPSGQRGPLLVANTIAGNDATEGSAIYASGFPDRVLLVNDVLASPDAVEAVLCDFTRSTVGPTFDHVLAHAEGASAYAVCPDPTGASGNLSAPPLFAAAADYRLSAGSPGVDAGLATAPLLPVQDLAGGPRITGATVDVGAWESPGPGLAIAPGRVDFGTVPPGGASTATVTLSNGGASGVAVGGAAVSPPFALAGGTCGGALAPGASCTFEVAFEPASRGAQHGALTPIVDGARIPFPVVLAGDAAAVDLAHSPLELRFENVFVGQQSPASTVTISNPNALAVAIDAVTLTGTDATWFAQTNDCPASLAPGGACTAAVTCTPLAVSWGQAALVPTGPFLASQGIPLVCSGAPPIEPGASLSPAVQTVQAGGTGVFALQIARAGWLADALTLTCGVDARAASCTVDPSSFAPGVGQAAGSVSVHTTGGGGGLGSTSDGGRRDASPLAFALLVLGLAPLARRRALALAVALALGSLSCIRDRDPNVTARGTYTVTVTVTSQTGSQTVTATLVVG